MASSTFTILATKARGQTTGHTINAFRKADPLIAEAMDSFDSRIGAVETVLRNPITIETVAPDPSDVYQLEYLS